MDAGYSIIVCLAAEMAELRREVQLSRRRDSIRPQRLTGKEEDIPKEVSKPYYHMSHVHVYVHAYRSLRMCGRQSKSQSPGTVGDEEAKLEVLLPSMTVCGTIEFKMDKKSYRMIPLANSEDYLYNRATLTKARVVCMCVSMCMYVC